MPNSAHGISIGSVCYIPKERKPSLPPITNAGPYAMVAGEPGRVSSHANGVSRERRQAKRRESQLDNSACVFSDGLCQAPGCLKDAGKSLV